MNETPPRPGPSRVAAPDDGTALASRLSAPVRPAARAIRRWARPSA